MLARPGLGGPCKLTFFEKKGRSPADKFCTCHIRQGIFPVADMSRVDPRRNTIHVTWLQ